MNSQIKMVLSRDLTVTKNEMFKYWLVAGWVDDYKTALRTYQSHAGANQ